MITAAPTITAAPVSGGERGMEPQRFNLEQRPGQSGSRGGKEKSKGILDWLQRTWARLTNREKPAAARGVLEEIVNAGPTATEAPPVAAAPAATMDAAPADTAAATGTVEAAPDVSFPARADGGTATAPATPASDATEVAPEAVVPSQNIETPEQTAVIDPLFHEAARLSLDAGSIQGVFFAGVGRHAIGSTAIGTELRRACLDKLSSMGVATRNKKTTQKIGVLQQGITDILGKMQAPSESPALAFFQANKGDLAKEVGPDVDKILSDLRSGKAETFDVVSQLLRGNGEISKKLRIETTGSADMLPSIGDTSKISGASDLLQFSGLSGGLIPNPVDIARIKRAHGKWTVTWDALKGTGVNLMIAVIVYNMFSAESDAHGQSQH